MATSPATSSTSKSYRKAAYSVAMNVVVMPATNAEEKCRKKAGMTRPTVDEDAAGGAMRGNLVPGLPRTPSHNLIFRGGRTIADLTFSNFYIGGAAAWKVNDRANIDSALEAAMSDARLNEVMAQYFNNPITSRSRGPSKVLDGVPPVSFSRGDVEALLTQMPHRSNWRRTGN